jgi:alanyl aminopeptidase
MDLDVKVLNGLESFRLHQARLKFEACSLFSEGRTLPCTWQSNEETQTVEFFTSELLPPGRATIHIRWTVNVSALPDPTVGGDRFWKALFVQNLPAGGFHMITQFEPCNARFAFPCFDQPCTRCSYRLSFSNLPSDLTILSCTEMSSEEADGPKTKRVVFKVWKLVQNFCCFFYDCMWLQPTQPTPAYLVAWVVGAFERVERTIMLPSYNKDVSQRASSRMQPLTVR